MTGLFASLEANTNGANGLFYGNPRLLGVQILAVSVSITLSCVGTFVILSLLKLTIGLRTHVKFEEDGLDASVHGEEAFEPPKLVRALSRKFPSFRKLQHLPFESQSESSNNTTSPGMLTNL